MIGLIHFVSELTIEKGERDQHLELILIPRRVQALA